jgi:hypothetical protein
MLAQVLFGGCRHTKLSSQFGHPSLKRVDLLADMALLSNLILQQRFQFGDFIVI